VELINDQEVMTNLKQRDIENTKREEEEDDKRVENIDDKAINDAIMESLDLLHSHHVRQHEGGHDLKSNESTTMTSFSQPAPQPQAPTRKLIGDHSDFLVLPCTSNTKHTDLNVIQTDTLSKLLNNQLELENVNSDFEVIIIDSRYPYEYEGGHIRTAKNIYTKEGLVDFMFSDVETATTTTTSQNNKRKLVIFHCEFSSERGPSLLRFLREQDRKLNANRYPKLFYPELYLLDGGYKAFYETHQYNCEPKMYKPMLHKDHLHELKIFRAKTKQWNKFSSMTSSSSAYKMTTIRSLTDRLTHLKSTADPSTSRSLSRFRSNLF
jgi:rhodanese-related sulfurtransferase